jgi:hypothetical protein
MMRSLRVVGLAVAGSLLSTEALRAHPGHVTEGGFVRSVAHVLGSPYHVAVVVALVVLAVAVRLALRPAGAPRVSTRETDHGGV